VLFAGSWAGSVFADEKVIKKWLFACLISTMSKVDAVAREGESLGKTSGGSQS